MTTLTPAAMRLTAVALTAVLARAACAAPAEVWATYNGYMNGMSIGVISEHFESGRGAYTVVSDTRPTGLAAFIRRQPLRFTSRGALVHDGLRPARFEARRNAGEPPEITADFDWSTSRLVLTHNGKAESARLAAGTQDRLSISYQFMFMPLEHARKVEFSMTNGRKLDHYHYRITPDVELDTPLGRLKTLHLVKQREPDDTVTEIWLSSAHGNFPVKVLIVEKNGVRFEQIIQSLEQHD